MHAPACLHWQTGCLLGQCKIKFKKVGSQVHLLFLVSITWAPWYSSSQLGTEDNGLSSLPFNTLTGVFFTYLENDSHK